MPLFHEVNSLLHFILSNRIGIKKNAKSSFHKELLNFLALMLFNNLEHSGE